MHCGANGADLLARRVLALLARNRLEKCLWIEERLVVAGRIVGRGFSFLVIAVDANPVHFAAAHHLILADDRNVVLRLASDHASVATVAFVQVDGHRPLVALIGELGFAVVERQFLRGRFSMFVGEVRILAVLLERSSRENLTAFHIEVILGTGERIVFAGFLDRAAWG